MRRRDTILIVRMRQLEIRTIGEEFPGELGWAHLATFICIIFGCSLMWAIEPVLIKLAFTSSDFMQTSGIRSLAVALTAFVYVLISNRGNMKIAPSKLPWIVYIALVGTVFADLCYIYALTMIPVINAALIGHIQPVFIVFIGFLFLKTDRLTVHDYFGILVMIAAALLVSTKTFENLSSKHIEKRISKPKSWVID